MNQGLVDYIKRCREQGIADNLIRDKLKEAGFPEVEIEEAIRYTSIPATSSLENSEDNSITSSPENKEEELNKSKKTFTIVLIVLIVAAVVILIPVMLMGSNGDDTATVADLLEQANKANNNTNKVNNKNNINTTQQKPVVFETKDCGQSSVIDLSSNVSTYADDETLICMGDVLLEKCEVSSYGLINIGNESSENVTIIGGRCALRFSRWCPLEDLDSKIASHQASENGSAEFFLEIYNECVNKWEK